MERFLKRVAPAPSEHPPVSKKSKNSTAKQGNVNADRRLLDYPKGTFYVDNKQLFCRFCNVVIDHCRKSVVDAHLKTKSHSDKVNNARARYFKSKMDLLALSC